MTARHLKHTKKGVVEKITKNERTNERTNNTNRTWNLNSTPRCGCVKGRGCDTNNNEQNRRLHGTASSLKMQWGTRFKTFSSVQNSKVNRPRKRIRAPGTQPLPSPKIPPIVIPSNYIPENGFPVVKALPSPRDRPLQRAYLQDFSLMFYCLENSPPTSSKQVVRKGHADLPPSYPPESL